MLLHVHCKKTDLLHDHCKKTDQLNMIEIAKEFVDGNQARLKTFGRF